MRKLRHIYRLGLKELIVSFMTMFLSILVIYCFTVMVIVPSRRYWSAGAQLIAMSTKTSPCYPEELSTRSRCPFSRPPVPLPITISTRSWTGQNTFNFHPIRLSERLAFRQKSWISESTRRCHGHRPREAWNDIFNLNDQSGD